MVSIVLTTVVIAEGSALKKQSCLYQDVRSWSVMTVVKNTFNILTFWRENRIGGTGRSSLYISLVH